MVFIQTFLEYSNWIKCAHQEANLASVHWAKPNFQFWRAWNALVGELHIQPVFQQINKPLHITVYTHYLCQVGSSRTKIFICDQFSFRVSLFSNLVPNSTKMIQDIPPGLNWDQFCVVEGLKWDKSLINFYI